MEPSITPFRGLSGEVIRSFIQPGTFYTLTFVFLLSLLITVALAILLGHFAGLPPAFLLLALYVAISPIYGRFALGAMNGQLGAGFFELAVSRDELFPFVQRNAALALAWGIPTAVLLKWLVVRSFSSVFLEIHSASTAFTVLLTLGTLGFLFLAPSICLIVALRSQSVRECFSAQHWLWLFGSRRGDLIPFYAAAVGGFVMFWLVFLVPLLVLVALGFAMSAKIGFFLSTWVYVLPVAMAPVLLGRLAGAFVGAESFQPSPGEIGRPVQAQTIEARLAAAVSRAAPAKPAVGAPLAVPRPSAAKPGDGSLETPSLSGAIRQIKDLAGKEPARALSEARAHLGKFPGNAGILAEIAKLQLALGETDQAVQDARTAIGQALSSGATPVAVEVYQSFLERKAELNLDGRTYEQLSKVLLNQGNFSESLWCICESEKAGGDLLKVQKGIIGIAQEASKKQPELAQRYYQYFTTQYPESPFAQFCQEAMKHLKSDHPKP